MVKQIIIVRGDLIAQMGIGKLAAQVAHCSMKIFFDRMEDIQHDNDTSDNHTFCFSVNNAEKEWIEGPFTKVVVKCKNLNELLKIERKAITAGIPCAKIEDNGNTVFRKDCEYCWGVPGIITQMNYQTKQSQEIICPKCSGKGTIAVPTITCLAIGPAKEEDLQPITGRLRLL